MEIRCGGGYSRCGLLVLFGVLANSAAAGTPLTNRSAAGGPIATWGELTAAITAGGGSGTYTLSGPSFSMTGFTGFYGITMRGDSDSLTIVGAGDE